MKRIKDFFATISAIFNVFYIFANNKKLTKFQSGLILSLNEDLRNGKITMKQHQEEMKTIKKNIKMK